MRILLSGPPSSGKSAQGAILAEHLGIPHVSSGRLIRDLAESGDPRGVALLNLVSDGSLAPSETICALVENRLARPDCAGGFVLDGFPRKLAEAAFVTARHHFDAMVVLDVPPPVLMERLRERAAEGRRDDDPDKFPRRIQVYEAESHAVQDEIVARHIPIVRIDASGAKAGTAAAIRETIDRLALLKQARPTAKDMFDLRDLTGLDLDSCRRAAEHLRDPHLGPKLHGDLLLAACVVDSNQLAINVRGDRTAWNFDRAISKAADLRERFPEIAARFPAPSAGRDADEPRVAAP